MPPFEKNRLVVGSRKSGLAMWQTEHVIERLQRAWPDVVLEIRTYVTEGDDDVETALPEIGGKGVFTTRLEQALAAEEIDLAVHSLKDLPVDTGREFTIGAVTSRTDPRDCVVARNAWTLATLPRGAVVGTCSLRRQGQLLARRPDLLVKPIRGNVDTRVRKVLDGEYDAALLAAAGVTRLGLATHVTEWIPAEAMLPAPGQGALAVQCRTGDKETLLRLAAIDEPGGTRGSGGRTGVPSAPGRRMLGADRGIRARGKRAPAHDRTGRLARRPARRSRGRRGGGRQGARVPARRAGSRRGRAIDPDGVPRADLLGGAGGSERRPRRTARRGDARACGGRVAV